MGSKELELVNAVGEDTHVLEQLKQFVGEYT